MLARYGGEESAAILVGSDRTEAGDTAARVLQAVSDLGIAHSGSTTRPHVTVSIGVTTVEPGGTYSHEQAVRLADIALYASKERGRDAWSFHATAEEGAAPAAPGLLKTAS